MEWRTSVGGKTLRVARRRGSVFDLPAQHLSVEGKIVAALDRLARALCASYCGSGRRRTV